MMMKKPIVFCVFLCALAVTALLSTNVGRAAAQSQPGVAEISFSFARQSGFASNQFAVWVEDAQGNYVKTLYATKFTAKGGWERRPTSILQWVKQSSLSKMPKGQIDAFTGPTPKSGNLIYRWDGTNEAGAAVLAGDYRLFLEASLRNENRVVYSATIPSGGDGSGNLSGSLRPAEVTAEYFGTSTKERGMISAVQVRVGKLK
jgi:hypothetical protein